MEEYTVHLKFPYKTLITSANLVHIHNNGWSSKTLNRLQMLN
jgi:hypothetical protein